MSERTYTFFLRDDSDSPPAFEISICESPQAARSMALKLLNDRPRYRAVEVSDDLTSFLVERGERT